MSKAVKIAVISTIVLGVGVATFFIIRNVRNKLGGKKGKESDDDTNDGGGKSTTTTKPKEPEYDPTADAKELHRSMEGGGTYEDVFWKVTNKLTSAQKNMVKGKFNSKYGSLKDWIEGDFSWSEEDRALKAWGYPA
tara:strand:- start:5269 stop:5676 length:408 start_codon:yes stop_codon:yes gene_type:complete